MISGHPEKEKKKDDVCADHLGFLGSGKHRAECDPQSGCRNIIPQNTEETDQQTAQDKKEPEGKRDLL